MRKLFSAFLLAAFAIPTFACDIRPSKRLLFAPMQFTPVAYPLTGCRSFCSSSALCNASVFPLMRKSSFALNPLARTYAGIPFHTGAVFCRMENYTLCKYSVKFSLHAGGYRE